jgi:transcriptional regulator with XRE-family HTH domain
MCSQPNTMLMHLAWAAKQARQRAGCRVADVAHAAKVDGATVYRFERQRSYPAHVDELIAAYAELAGITPREIWCAALKHWQ